MRHGKDGPTDPTRQFLKPDAWPEADRRIWEAALQPAGLLEDGGAAATWADITQRGIARAYGRWIAWLAADRPDRLALPPAERASREALIAYAELLLTQVAISTVVIYIRDLRYALEVIAPEADWKVLRTLLSRINRHAKPARNKADRVVSSRELFSAGLAMMETAKAMTADRPIDQACLFRDGLIIAFLAALPLRLSNLALIRIGEHLVEGPDGYLLNFEPHETKTRTHKLLDIPFPKPLLEPLDAWLTEYRPRLVAGRQGWRRGRGSTSHLWVSLRGSGMSPEAIYGAIIRHTKAAFGHSLNPHLFRDCAATSIMNEAPEHAGIIKDILGHSTRITSERHYIHARSGDAIDRQQKLIATLRRRLSEPTS